VSSLAQEPDRQPARDSTWVGVDCALCGSSSRELRFREGTFEVLRCLDCGLVYVSPRRVAEALIAEVYDASYWNSDAPRERGYADYDADEALWRRTWRARLAALESQLPAAGRALDVGCASGLFLEQLKASDWQVEGVEPSQTMNARAILRLGGTRVHGGRFEDLQLEAGIYDLVTLWDVIEHLVDPVEALRNIRRLLAPEGRVVVLTQDVSSLLARALGHRWHHYKHDEHLLHFSPHTLARALAEAGLRARFSTRRGTGKWVRWSFIVERSRRLGRPLAACLSCLPISPELALYVNPHDELMLVAEVAEA
jgi:2-polyprenyl-3-methyl-5-hydroxy-6-metoxy-1,4-benzoquinol methylase